MVENNFVTNSIVNTKSARIVTDVRTLWTFPGSGLWQICVKFGYEVRVRQVGVEIPVGRE